MIWWRGLRSSSEWGTVKKLRVDTTVVQTDIHHPTDSTLLWDVVRVVTRLVGRLSEALGRPRIKGFRDRTRSARHRMQDIQRMMSVARDLSPVCSS